jgi:hypothetical protein
MVGQSGRNQGDDQQGRAIRDAHFQPGDTYSTVAEQTGTGSCPPAAAAAAATGFSETGPKSRSGRADAACAWHYPKKSPTTAAAASTVDRGGIAPVVVNDSKLSASFAPVVVRRVRLTIGPGRKKIVFVRMFNPRAAINVDRAPGIFWKFFEEWVPAGWSGLGVGLGHERLQTLFGSRIKTVHRFVLHQLSADGLNVGPNCGRFRETCGVAHFRDRETEQYHDDADHDHDLKQGEARLSRSSNHW